MASRATTTPKRTAERSRSDAIINLRIAQQKRDLIDSAAEVLGKTRTEFVVDSATQQATDVLLDQRLFRLDRKQFAAFQAALDAPPRPNEKLRRLLKKKAPWEK